MSRKTEIDCVRTTLAEIKNNLAITVEKRNTLEKDIHKKIPELLQRESRLLLGWAIRHTRKGNTVGTQIEDNILSFLSLKSEGLNLLQRSNNSLTRRVFPPKLFRKEAKKLMQVALDITQKGGIIGIEINSGETFISFNGSKILKLFQKIHQLEKEVLMLQGLKEILEIQLQTSETET